MTNQAAQLERALLQPGISPDELFELGVLGVSRNSIYAACRSGEIENFRIGRRIVIPTAPLRRKLGLEPAA